MPQFSPNINLSDCWSSVGNITFYHRDGKCYWRSKPYSQYRGTLSQQEHLQVHQRALSAWRTIPHSQQRKWSEYAKTVTAHRPPFLKENHISGHNLFVSAFHGFATLGEEHTPVPQPFEDFPPFYADFLSASEISGTDLQLRFSISIGGETNPLRYRILGKIQLVEFGSGCNPGKMRNFLATETTETPTNPREITFTIPNYKSLFGLSDQPQYTLHLRYLLLDTVTGYRNTYHKLSSDIIV